MIMIQLLSTTVNTGIWILDTKISIFKGSIMCIFHAPKNTKTFQNLAFFLQEFLVREQRPNVEEKLGKHLMIYST